MIRQNHALLYYNRNIANYEKISYLNAAVLMWGVMTLYYNFKGLTFFEISLIQSIGAVITIVLEIPSGWLSDRYGHASALRIGALCNVAAVFLLIVSNNFVLFLAAEIFSATASAAQSGADTALFYDSLIQTGRQEEYSAIRAKIRGRQSLIRIGSRLIAPLTFSVFGSLPFICSGIIYFIITGLTFRYATFGIHGGESQSGEEHKKEKEGSFKIIAKYRRFILYSVLSAFILVSVSNYSQYISPFLAERGLDIKWLGVILALGSIGDYAGTKFIPALKRMKGDYALVLLAIFISGFVFAGGVCDTIAGGALGYFGISLMYSPFAILLGECLNKVIDNKYRATLLSISNQFDEVFGVLMDPVIGIAIDLSGFRIVYTWLGIISSLFLVVSGVVMIKLKKNSERILH